jgi:hypothetical protein
MKLYRYFLPNKETFFSNLVETIFFPLQGTPPKFFNDPWDATIYFDSTDNDFLFQKLPKNISDGFFKEGVTPKVIASIEDSSNKNEIINRCFPMGSSSRYCYDFARDLAILCFCKTWDLPLLWSHYASSHRGICVCYSFDQQHLPNLPRFVQVKYSSEIPDKIPSHPLQDGNHEYFMQRLLDQLRTKSMHWSYECEIRLIGTTNQPLSDSFFPRLSVSKISPLSHVIPEITFGYSSTQEDKLDFFRAIKHSIAAIATGKINRLGGENISNDEINKSINESLLDIEFYQICGVDKNYKLLRDRISIPNEIIEIQVNISRSDFHLNHSKSSL